MITPPSRTQLTRGVAPLLLSLLLAVPTSARKFYDDDPLQQDPPPVHVPSVLSRRVNEYYDFFRNTFSQPGEQHTKTKLIPAQAVNTLGEVPDSAWYTNRHYNKRMTLQELVRGPGDENPPSMDGPWLVVAAKTEGITPGFTVRDSRGRRYILKFDPLPYPEIATAAEMISTKFFYALGYNVPENYLVTFDRKQLALAKGVLLKDQVGKEREMTDRDVTEILLKVPHNKDGKYRAVASLYLPGTPAGAFRYYGTRRDDPNDIVPHEHRRDLRGLSVFSAWLGHDDSRSINTLDTLVEENGIQYVRHYLIDFGSTLGSASTAHNSPRSGHEYLFAWKPALLQSATFGLAVPRWARARFPDLPSVGPFESETFDPERWVPEYPNSAFSNRLPDDAFWAAKQVMAFTDEEIGAIVKTGKYSDPRAGKWVADTLIARRDKIGRAFFSGVLPLDRFGVKDGRLVFEDLAVEHKLAPARNYAAQWYRFDNDAERKILLPNATTLNFPSELEEAEVGQYFAADIHSGDPAKMVTVYLRKKRDQVEVGGIERTWK